MSRLLWAGVALLLACASPALAQFWPVVPLGPAGHGGAAPSTFSNFAVGEAYMNKGIASNYATGSGYLND